MTKQELEDLAISMEYLVRDRRRLGEFDANAVCIIFLAETVLRLTEHLRDQAKK